MAETADIGKQQVGKVYAKALIGAAEKSGKTDDVVDELDSLVEDVLQKFPGFESTIGSPRLSPDEKNAMIDRVFSSQASDELKTFLKVLCQHERLDCLREISAEAKKIRNTLRNRIPVEVTTAHQLSDEENAKITHELQVKLSAEIELNHKIDEDIIGGIVVRVGDQVVDGSVRSKLEQMRASSVQRVVEQIHDSNKNSRFASS